MRQKNRRLAGVVFMAGVLLVPTMLRAQAPDDQSSGQGGRRGGQFAGMQRAMGEVVAVNGAQFTIKSQDGGTVTIVTTDNTRIMKGRGNTVKVADLKVGDGIVAAGNLDAPNKTLHAAFVMAQDAAEVAKERANLGKTYIMGKVTAIDADNAKMTVTRPDGVSQTIGFDETTSFRRGRPGGAMGRGGDSGAATAAPSPTAESLTLADIKVGDTVGGPGSVKGGVFVPSTLSVGSPGQGRRRGGPDAPAPAPTNQ